MENDNLLNDICATIDPLFRSLFAKGCCLGDSVENVLGWDSAAHVFLCLGVEELFGVSFDLKELPCLRSVRDICEKVMELRNA